MSSSGWPKPKTGLALLLLVCLAIAMLAVSSPHMVRTCTSPVEQNAGSGIEREGVYVALDTKHMEGNDLHKTLIHICMSLSVSMSMSTLMSIFMSVFVFVFVFVSLCMAASDSVSFSVFVAVCV